MVLNIQPMVNVQITGFTPILALPLITKGSSRAFHLNQDQQSTVRYINAKFTSSVAYSELGKKIEIAKYLQWINYFQTQLGPNTSLTLFFGNFVDDVPNAVPTFEENDKSRENLKMAFIDEEIGSI